MPPTADPAASIDVGTVRQRFNWDWTADPDSFDGADTYWWWARSIRVDPNEIIADDDEGNLWSVPFATDGADDVTFGEPVRVRETFVPVADGDGAAASAVVSRRRQRTVAAALERPDKPADPAHPSTTTREDPRMDMTALRSEYNIGTDVSDDDIADVLGELATDTDPSADTSQNDDDTTSDEPEGEPSLVALAAENAALRSAVDRLSSQETDRSQREAAAAREQTLSAAVRDGRITPHERTAVWEPFYDADAAAATAQLAALPVNTHHVVEVGHAGGADDDPETAAFEARRARLTGRTKEHSDA